MNTYEVALKYLDDLQKEDAFIFVPVDEAVMMPVPHHIFHSIASKPTCIFCNAEMDADELDDKADWFASTY